MAAASHDAATASGFGLPPGHALRRARTVDDSRVRAPVAPVPLQGPPPRRRSSSLSDYSSEARDLLNPQPQDRAPAPEASSPLAHLSLAFALLPAIAGALFNNGHAVVTDVMLLGLAGVFLHWSVTQPWAWYHAAQQVRLQHEADPDQAVEDSGDDESPPAAPARSRPPLDDVPEEDEAAGPEGAKAGARAQAGLPQKRETTARQRAALGELYVHEVLALVACLVLPLVSTYLLHAIRTQLSRPSEGLVSNYNLTIFLLASELRVSSHMLKLVQSRTLHLQRVAHGNPLAPPSGTGARVDELVGRVARLETRALAAEAGADGDAKDEAAAAARDVRNAMQPELDALNRAVRRYEKKATLLQLQTEARFLGLDARLDEAVALAAEAARSSSRRIRSVLARAAEVAAGAALLPLRAAAELLLLPLRCVATLTGGGRLASQAEAKPARSRSGKAAAVQARQGAASRATKRP